MEVGAFAHPADEVPLVLVVDDYADAQAMYGLRLRQAGYRVAFAENGDMAVAVALARSPSVIVMDLCLPGKDGWEATRELKANPSTSNVPIIAVSGAVTTEHVKRAYEAGCDVFLPKPCLPDTLVAQVRRVAAAHDGIERDRGAPGEGPRPH